MVKHTPTPWVDGFGCRIYDAEQGSVAMTSGEASDYGVEINQANAAHIVRCVNQHDNLVAALRGMLEWARRVEGLNPGLEVASAVDALKQAEEG